MTQHETRNCNPETLEVLELENLETALGEARPSLDARLALLTNAYHNGEHCQEVSTRMGALLANLRPAYKVDKRTWILCLEAALRHDDGHSGGGPIRQDQAKGGLSHEEVAVRRMREDFAGYSYLITEADLQFMASLILSTTFGQNENNGIYPGDTRYRNYQNKGLLQILIRLADIGGIFTKPWDEWYKESMGLYHENPRETPESVEDWLQTRKNFADKYVRPLLDQAKDFLTPEYYQELLENLDKIQAKVNALLEGNFEAGEKEKYTQELERLRAGRTTTHPNLR